MIIVLFQCLMLFVRSGFCSFIILSCASDINDGVFLQ